MTPITLAEAQQGLADLLRKGAAGQEIEVRGDGVTYSIQVTLKPQEPRARRTPNLHPGSAVMHEGFDDPLQDAFWLGDA